MILLLQSRKLTRRGGDLSRTFFGTEHKGTENESDKQRGHANINAGE
jgi:hypothetical protein